MLMRIIRQTNEKTVILELGQMREDYPIQIVTSDLAST